MPAPLRNDFFYRLWPAEIERLRDLEARDWPTFFRVLLTLLTDGPPPLVRADAFWRARAEARTIADWVRARDRLALAGVITVEPDGGISAPWAVDDWKWRQAVSERNSANARRSGRSRAGRESTGSGVRVERLANENVQQKQGLIKATAARSMEDSDRESIGPIRGPIDSPSDAKRARAAVPTDLTPSDFVDGDQLRALAADLRRALR